MKRLSPILFITLFFPLLLLGQEGLPDSGNERVGMPKEVRALQVDLVNLEKALKDEFRKAIAGKRDRAEIRKLIDQFQAKNADRIVARDALREQIQIELALDRRNENALNQEGKSRFEDLKQIRDRIKQIRSDQKEMKKKLNQLSQDERKKVIDEFRSQLDQIKEERRNAIRDERTEGGR